MCSTAGHDELLERALSNIQNGCGEQAISCAVAWSLRAVSRDVTNASLCASTAPVLAAMLRIEGPFNWLTLVTRAMDLFPDSALVQGFSCRFLARLPDANVVVAANCVPRVVYAMERHTDDVFVQAEGCEALASCVNFGGEDGWDAVEESRGVAAVLTAALHFPSSANVQESAINLLGSQPVCKSLSRKDAAALLDLTLAALHAYGSFEDLRAHCCQALGNLACEPQSCDLVQSKAAACISALLTLMREHEEDDDFQWRACAVFYLIAKRSATTQPFHSEMFTSAVCAMHRYRENGNVQKMACKVIATLGVGMESWSAACASALLGAAGAMQRHATNVFVQLYVVRAVHVLLDLGGACVRKALFDNGGVEMLRNMLALHPENAQLQRHGAFLQYYLAQ